MRKAIYAGSFDPFTNGHLEILNRSINLFDVVYVIVANNPNKKHMFSQSKREKMISDTIGMDPKFYQNVYVEILDIKETIAEKAKELDVGCIVRGIRGHTDIDGEKANARINKEINSNLETILLIPDINLEELSSSMVRSLIGLNGWEKLVKNRVPEPIFDVLKLYSGIYK